MLRSIVFGCIVSIFFSSMVFGKVLDPMEDTEGWGVYTHEESKLTLESVKGKKGKAVKMDYILDPGAWVAIDKSDMNKDMSQVTRFMFTCKRRGNINPVEFKIQDADGSIFGKVFDGTSIGKKWTVVIIPLSEMEYLWGGDNMMDWKRVTNISFAVSKRETGEGGSGEFILDQIEYTGVIKDSPKAEPKKEKEPPKKVSEEKPIKGAGTVLDPMDSTEGWNANAEENAKVDLTTVEANGGKAVEVSYDFTGGNWVQMVKEIKMDLSAIIGIRFSYKGEGPANTLEIKLEDEDGSNFGKKWPAATGSKKWTTVTVSKEGLEYWWGGDDKMDWGKTKSIILAVSKKDGDKGGKGKVIIGKIETVK
ncbi:MAG: hypothetical protein JW983_10020 [Elusimicrobia bacterium]|nr:hypothetical protein [Elusimicrobiota bacterium]